MTEVSVGPERRVEDLTTNVRKEVVDTLEMTAGFLENVETNPDRWDVDAPEIRHSGDVVLRKPPEGWSRAVYEDALHSYVAVRGAYPRTARLHPSALLAIAPVEGVLPRWWPVSEVGRHYAPSHIILSDDAPHVLVRAKTED